MTAREDHDCCKFRQSKKVLRRNAEAEDNSSLEGFQVCVSIILHRYMTITNVTMSKSVGKRIMAI